MIKSGDKINLFSYEEMESNLVTKVEELAVSSKWPEWTELIVSSDKTVVCSFDCGGSKYIFKAFMNRSFTDPLKNIISGPRALKAERGTMLLRENGFNAPEVICIGGGMGVKVGSSFIVTEFIDAAYNAATFFRDVKVRKERNKMAAELGSVIGQLHNKYIYHGDLRPGNVLIKGNGNPKFYFIDNERNRERQSFDEDEAVTNLVQMNMLQISIIGRTDRMRFFREYIKETGLSTDNSKRIARKVWKLTEKRMETNRLGGLYS